MAYASLGRDERRQPAGIAARAAGSTPVLIGIGATRTQQVLRLADDAEQAGAAASPAR